MTIYLRYSPLLPGHMGTNCQGPAR
jgi:hypothetical protein